MTQPSTCLSMAPSSTRHKLLDIKQCDVTFWEIMIACCLVRLHFLKVETHAK